MGVAESMVNVWSVVFPENPIRLARCVRMALIGLGLAHSILPQDARAGSNVQSSSFVASNPLGSATDFDTRAGANGAIVHVSSLSTLAGMIFSGGPPLPPAGTQTGSGYGFATATEGTLRAYATAGAQTSPLVQNATIPHGAATAQWSDQLTIDSPGRTGQSGTVNATISIFGSFGSGVGNRGPLDDPGSDAFVRFLGTGLPIVDTNQIAPQLVEICGGWAYCGRDVNRIPNPYSGSNFTPTISLSIPFTFGSPLTLGYTLDVFARGSASSFAGGDGTSAGGLSNYSGGLQWGGITSVLDANGLPVPDYTTISTSGFDYGSAAVPEPQASTALAAGLLGLCGLRGFRGRRATARRTRL